VNVEQGHAIERAASELDGHAVKEILIPDVHGADANVRSRASQRDGRRNRRQGGGPEKEPPPVERSRKSHMQFSEK
jgi:hypothetical protein